MSARFKDPWTWFYGLVAAFIGGCTGVIADVGADLLMDGSVILNVKKLGIKAAVMGAILAAGYLRQSPLPPIEKDPPNV
jgi:hypothetical protein